jgi:hypothetical protein
VELPQEDCLVFTLQTDTAGYFLCAHKASLFFVIFRFYYRNIYASNVNMQLIFLFICIISVIFSYFCNENQLDALVVLNLFRKKLYMFRTYLLPIIRRYSLYMYNSWYVLYV